MTEQVIEQTVDTPVEATVETSVEPIQEPEVAVEASVEAPEVVESTEEPSDTSDTKEEDTSTEAVSVDNLTFEGHTLGLDVPAESVAMLQEHGFNASELAQELFSGDEFGFSEATHSKLVEAYGKPFVDMAIANARMTSQNTLREFNEAQEAGAKQAFEAVSELCGGEEGWTKLEEFSQTLPPEDVAAFNEAMDSGNPMFQRFAVEALVNRMPKGEEGEAGLQLIEGKAGMAGAPTAISAEEYRASMANGEYYKDPAKWDALRRQGQAKGI